jgi:tetratricopeptide (TPR) repeat protein
MPRLVFAPDSPYSRAIVFEQGTLTVGQSEDNNVCVKGAGIAEHHVRFEQRDNLVVVIDLGSDTGTYVDGRAVEQFVLGHRSVVKVGDLEILFLEDAVSPVPTVVDSSALQRQPSGPFPLAREVSCPNCGASLPASATICGHCGMMLPQGAGGVPAPVDAYIRPAPQARGAGILPMLSFFLGLFGPLVIIGWLLGIIFGFISLSLIRQRGGFMRDRRYAIWGIGLGFAWFAILLAAGVLMVQGHREKKTRGDIETAIKQNETDVAYLLKEIAVVEEFLKSSQAVALEQGGSGFATLKQLQGLPNPFLRIENLQENNKGYLFTVKAHWGDDFTASAVPLRYGVTGRKTFSMDHTGVLRGADIGGKQPWEYNAVLPELEMGRSVYLEARERLARELLVEARRLAEEGKFDRSQFILKELQKKYVLTETFKNFEGVAKGVEQLIINAQAQAALDKVRPLLAENKRAEAAAALKKIATDFPKAVNVEEIKAQAAGIEAQLVAERNNVAAGKWAEVVKLDQSGKADEALAAYRAFAGQFPDTATYAGNKGNLEAAIARIEEGKASTLFASLPALARTNASQVISIVTQLQGGYPNAPTVKNNLTMLQGLQQQAQAYLYVEEGAALQKQQKYVEATDRYDKALVLNPSLMKDLVGDIESCYFEAGEAYFRANKLADAAAAYEKFLSVTSDPEKLEKIKLKQIYLSLGEIHYLNKSYTNALVYLKKGAEYFGAEPKYYRMYGQALLKQKKYDDALPPYQSLVALNKEDPQARFERALCLLGSAQEQQSNLVVAITAASATNAPIAAAEQRPTTWSQYVLPPSVVDRKLKKDEIEVIKEKHLEMRLSDTLDRLKSYSSATPEATIIREAVRLVNEVQASAKELDDLSKDAKTELSKSKINRARSQLLSVFSTQQDYFDKIISEKITLKQDLIVRLDKYKIALDTSSTDLTAASSVEAYRLSTVELNEAVQKKLALFNAGYGQMKPVLETEIKALEEARTLTKLAVSQFKGWAIGWNLDDRINRFFLLNYSEMVDKKASGEKQLRESFAIPVAFEKHVGT